MNKYYGAGIAASSWFFLLLGNYTVSFQLVPKWFVSDGSTTTVGFYLVVLFQFFFICAGISHLRATFMQPGYTPKFPVPADIPLELVRYCEYCDQWKPDRTHHCRACNKCIHRMDHHCPWINNCVGAKNQKFFCLFLFYVFLCCLQTLLMMLYIAILYFYLKDKSFKGLLSLLVSVFTGVIASIFLGFTAVMLYDQIEVILANQTEVEKMSKKCGKNANADEHLKKALGNNYFNWFNPLADSPEPDYSESLYPSSNNLKQQ